MDHYQVQFSSGQVVKFYAMTNTAVSVAINTLLPRQIKQSGVETLVIVEVKRMEDGKILYNWGWKH